MTGISEKEPYLKAEVELLEETDFGIEDEIQKEAMARNLREVLTEYAAQKWKNVQGGSERTDFDRRSEEADQ